MLLTDTDILAILQTERNIDNLERVVICPFEEKSLSPVGYDLRAGLKYQLLHEGVELSAEYGEILIPPGETISVQTLEWIAMPMNKSLSGFITSRVMLVSSGLSHISTTVDPDWIGNLLITMTNHSKVPYIIYPGERICTLSFIQNKSIPQKLSHHAPGRPDALNQNASRIASEYIKQNNRLRSRIWLWWVFTGFIYSLILYYAYIKFGSNEIFVAMVGAGVVLSGFGMDVIRSILNKRDK